MIKNRLLKSAIIPFTEYESLMRDYVQKQKLQQRIDKAIECLNYYTCNKEFLSVEEQELYEILKGEDKGKSNEEDK